MRTAREMELLGEVSRRGSTFWSFMKEWFNWRWIESRMRHAVKKGYKAVVFKADDVSSIELFRLEELGYYVEEMNSGSFKVSW